MKNLVLAAMVVAALYFGLGKTGLLRQFDGTSVTQGQLGAGQGNALASAFAEKKSAVKVTGEGAVAKLLPDDDDGSRHQRFILILPSGQTLLVAHNIDLAPRIASLNVGDAIAFSGVYAWNAKGAVIHSTHRDSSGRHQAGWLKHTGQTHQ